MEFVISSQLQDFLILLCFNTCLMTADAGHCVCCYDKQKAAACYSVCYLAASQHPMQNDFHENYGLRIEYYSKASLVPFNVAQSH